MDSTWGLSWGDSWGDAWSRLPAEPAITPIDRIAVAVGEVRMAATMAEGSRNVSAIDFSRTVVAQDGTRQAV